MGLTDKRHVVDTWARKAITLFQLAWIGQIGQIGSGFMIETMEVKQYTTTKVLSAQRVGAILRILRLGVLKIVSVGYRTEHPTQFSWEKKISTLILSADAKGKGFLAFQTALPFTRDAGTSEIVPFLPLMLGEH